ncbi:major capsid protein [Microvirus sp.]|nr:major capsid protein [Microvirus sp.]
MAIARFPKINVGRANKRGRFDLSHGVSTTFDFGSVQPLFCKLMMPKSSIKGDFSGAVRCMPMPLPPFGKCGLHMYGQFVKMGDLLRNFGSFVSRQLYTSVHSSYVPEKLPNLPIYGSVSLVSLLLTPRFSFWCPLELATLSINNSPSDNSVGGVRFQFMDDVDATDLHNLHDYLITNAKVSTAAFRDYFGFTSTALSPEDTNTFNGFSDVNRVGNGEFTQIADAGFSLLNADFFLTSTAKNLPVDSGSTTMFAKPAVCAVWLTAEGRRLVKILNGLGIQVNLTDTSRVSLMPLFAYYKAWFDLFAPKRDLIWTSTQAFRLLDWSCEFGVSDFDELGNNVNISSQGVNLGNLVEFLYDVSQTFATCDPNYITSSVNSANQSGATMQFDSPELDKNAASAKPSVNGGIASQSYPSRALSSIGIELINKLARYINTNNVIGKNIDAFFKSHFDGYSGCSDNSQFAGASVLDIELGDVIVTADTDVADAGEFAGVGFGRGDFRVKYSTDEFGFYIVLACVIPRSNYVQGSDYDVFITKPLELPTPELDALGWDKLRVSEVFGSGVYTRFEDQIVGNSAFGYQPRYTGHKVQNSKLMGDFKFNGTKANYLGMTLDNVITQDYVVPMRGFDYANPDPIKPDATLPNLIAVFNADSSRLMTSPNWRYLGKDKMLSNYDRIFKNSGVSTLLDRVPFHGGVSENVWSSVGTIPRFDNFVSHFEVSLYYSAPLANISASYFTLEGSDNYVDHE